MATSQHPFHIKTLHGFHRTAWDLACLNAYLSVIALDAPHDQQQQNHYNDDEEDEGEGVAADTHLTAPTSRKHSPCDAPLAIVSSIGCLNLNR